MVHLQSSRLRPVAALDTDAVLSAYRHQAGFYDRTFGNITRRGRLIAVQEVNDLPGRDVLEVGVGTGLALPAYAASKRVTGIDLSSEMLAVARARVASQRLAQVAALHEMNAEAMAFPDNSFDIAVAMYVASVVPNPAALLAEMRRVVRPGGTLLFNNHFAAKSGPRWWVERALAPLSRKLGWHPDFAMAALLDVQDSARATIRRMPPLGLFTLIRLPN